ncbi:MAG: pseudouridine synthase [Panacagrimonas sp.]
MKPVLPLRDGVGAGHVQVPPGRWPTLLDFLCERFPTIGRDVWRSRFERGLILDARAQPFRPSTPCRTGLELRYYRELDTEPRIPFEAQVIHRDEHLLIADKPHFLPVAPAGRYVQESLLVRLRRSLMIDHLVPLHRIDRGTAGLVAFSTNPQSLGVYQSLFRTHAMTKVYEALAPAVADTAFPMTRRSRIVEGEPFFRMREIEGEANSETHIEVLDRRGDLALYRLHPVTGRKHQLRVHLAALAAPILNDPLYPQLREEGAEDYSCPLKLLARALEFDDPLTGRRTQFESRLALI